MTNNRREAIVLTVGAQDVIAERIRQITGEGYTPGNDDHYVMRQLTKAGTAYAIAACEQDYNPETSDEERAEAINHWPWTSDTFKPRSYRENLVRAAALLLAEIDRLDRKEGRA